MREARSAGIVVCNVCGVLVFKQLDADGSRSAHMKQCMAIGCDPSDVEFAGSVRKGMIHANSLFNSENFKTALKGF